MLRYGFKLIQRLKGSPLNRKTYLISFVLLLLCFSAACIIPGGAAALSLSEADGQGSFDVLVYGGTPAGIAAAITAAREGAHVLLIEPGSHVGGMITSGLCATDTGNSYCIGGISREFFERVGRHYGKTISWYMEPHVAEVVFSEMLKEAGVQVVFNERLREIEGVIKSGTRISTIVMENGHAYSAEVFIDCTYEGDLMAQSGVSYTIGRESSREYGESMAGVRPFTAAHNFNYKVSAYDESGQLLPEIYDGLKGEAGEADHKVQAYNYRICITDLASNKLPFPRPEDYDPSRYALLVRWLDVVKEAHKDRSLVVGDVLSLFALPNGKYDVNNSGPFSTDYIGGSWDYPDADYAVREEIINDHKTYMQGLLYFLANDPQVPEELRKDMSRWGLAADEFTDNGNWPYCLYIREARRMTGDYVMTQKDIQENIYKPDAIGMGSYNSDSHNVQRVVTPEGYVENEGDMQVAVKPYQIPYRVMLPKVSEATNLLVPVCVSASHVAYSTLRMEPQFMIMGQAAGTAAVIAVDSHLSVQDIDVELLQNKLRASGAILGLPNFWRILNAILWMGLLGALYKSLFRAA